MLIAEVCHYYGWSVDHVLDMPAKRFFAMLEASRILRGQDYLYDCWTSRAGQMDKQGFLDTVDFFQRYGKPKEQSEFFKPGERGPATIKPRQELKGEEARQAVMGAFAKDNRINRRVKVTH
jgi:hypothetical protein